jgi:hypothetical protein
MVAEMVAVGGFATATVAVTDVLAVAVLPLLSVIVRTTGNVPDFVYVCEDVEPKPVVPSP